MAKTVVYPTTTTNIIEPVHEKTNNLGFRPGPTQTRLYSHRKRVGASKFGFKKQTDSTIRVAKTKTLISCAVTAQLICVFVFAHADFWFSHVTDYIIENQRTYTGLS